MFMTCRWPGLAPSMHTPVRQHTGYRLALCSAVLPTYKFAGHSSELLCMACGHSTACTVSSVLEKGI